MPQAAQRLIDYSGLQVCQHRPGRAVVNLMLVRYIDGDLGQYHEFGTAVMVNPPGSMPRLRALGDAPPSSTICPSIKLHSGGRTHDLGIPKDHGGLHRSREGRFGFDVSADGAHIAGIDFAADCRCPRCSRRGRRCSRPTPLPTAPPGRCPGKCGCAGCAVSSAGRHLRLRRSPLCQGAGVAGPAKAGDGLWIGRPRRDDIRRAARDRRLVLTVPSDGRVIRPI